jgi:hypothetical protein
MPLPDVYDMAYDQNRLGRSLLANQGGQMGVARGANRLGTLLAGGYNNAGNAAFLRGQVEGATTAEKMAQAQLVRNKLLAQESFAQTLENSGVPHEQALMYATAMQGGYNPHELMSARNVQDLMQRRADAIRTGTDPNLPGGSAALARMNPILAGMEGKPVSLVHDAGGVVTQPYDTSVAPSLDPLGQAHANLFGAQTALEGLRGQTEQARAGAEDALRDLRLGKADGEEGPGGPTRGRSFFSQPEMNAYFPNEGDALDYEIYKAQHGYSGRQGLGEWAAQRKQGRSDAAAASAATSTPGTGPNAIQRFWRGATGQPESGAPSAGTSPAAGTPATGPRSPTPMSAAPGNQIGGAMTGSGGGYPTPNAAQIAALKRNASDPFVLSEFKRKFGSDPQQYLGQ